MLTTHLFDLLRDRLERDGGTIIHNVFIVPKDGELEKLITTQHGLYREKFHMKLTTAFGVLTLSSLQSLEPTS